MKKLNLEKYQGLLQKKRYVFGALGVFLAILIVVVTVKLVLNHRREKAMILYEEYLETGEKKFLEKILKKYSGTSQALLARKDQAQVYFEKGKYQKAEQEMAEVYKASRLEGFRNLLIIAMAKSMYEQNKIKDCIAFLEKQIKKADNKIFINHYKLELAKVLMEKDKARSKKLLLELKSDRIPQAQELLKRLEVM
jgi:predicted negative regulator of RcsB-dependent stress response